MPRSTPGNTRQQGLRSRARLASLGLCTLRGCGAPARGEGDPPGPCATRGCARAADHDGPHLPLPRRGEDAPGPAPAYCPSHRLLRALAASRTRAASRAAKR